MKKIKVSTRKLLKRRLLSPRQKRKVARVATGVGLAVGGTAIAAGAAYTELMTSIVARRRTTLTDGIVAYVQGRPTEAPLASEGSLPIGDAWKSWESELRAKPTRLIAIRSRDGYILRGHWYPAENARRVVILVHGWHSRWSRDFCGIAPFLHEQGCSLLLVEQRCHGQSGGDLISYGINERFDIERWLCWVEFYHKGLPIYLYGMSMGAATVLMTTGLPIAGRVAGVISDCGYSDPRAIIQSNLEQNIGKLASPTLMAVNLNCKRREGFSFKDYTPRKAMEQNTEVPCLFVHGDADSMVPWEMSAENFRACNAPKELLIIHGAEHGVSFLIDPETYKQHVVNFMAAHDAPPKGATSDKRDGKGKKGRKKKGGAA